MTAKLVHTYAEYLLIADILTYIRTVIFFYADTYIVTYANCHTLTNRYAISYADA